MVDISEFEKLPFEWDLESESWILRSGDKFDADHAVLIGGILAGVSLGDTPTMALLNIRINASGGFKFFCIYTPKSRFEAQNPNIGDGVMCEIFPCVSAFFFARCVKVIPRHTLMAISIGLNEALS